MQPIHYHPVCEKEEDISKICDGFLRYYYDIKYLAKLYGSAAIDYFKFHGKKKMFYSIGYHRVAFDSF